MTTQRLSPPLARLLVVDDEVAQMQALCDTLQDHGYEVVGCAGGDDGLARLAESSFDLLLADLMMPGMDGITFLRSALKLDPMLVGVIMTGAGTISTAVAAMQSGAFDYVLKPFKLSAIVPVLERGLAMRRLRIINATLERRIRERSAELEAANIELEAFTRSVSHDLRTPLNAIVGFSELLSAQFGAQLPQHGRDWLHQIEHAGTRMNALIDDLLRLSRLGKQALNLAPVELEPLVQSVADELAQAGLTRHAQFSIGLLPQVMADESLLRQVFANLLSNAYKFTRRTEHAAIAVSCEQRGAEQLIVVRDNGAGFDMTQASRLFGAFERLHETQDFDGTGVGLTIVQRIVQRHGGRIWAESEPGHGASFFFTLTEAVATDPVN